MTVQIIDRVDLRSALTLLLASALLAGCGSSSESSGGGGHAIALNGGTGGSNGGTGGSGNSFRITKNNGAGDVKVLAGGVANTAFTVATITTSLGTNPAVVSASSAPDLYADCTATVTTPAGALYMVSTDSNLYISNGDAVACEGAEVATGLKVAAGATLTLPLNSSGTGASLAFANDIENRGQITTASNGGNRGSVDIAGASYLGIGTIDTSGTVAVPNGGSVYVQASYSIINSGAITASGADVTTGNGGSAGYIFLDSDRYTQNTAALTARGGDTTDAAGTGGNGYYLFLRGIDGAVRNSGLLDGRGGNGATGGSGAAIHLYSLLGGTYNSGNIHAYGATSTIGSGGNGGHVEFITYAGDIRNSGDVLAYGGDTSDTAGNGGSGNQLSISGQSTCVVSGCVPMGSITWSGDIRLNGGNAVDAGSGNGGNAGNVQVTLSDPSPSYQTAAADVAFVGYSELRTYGGDGDYGNHAGDYDLYNYDGYVSGGAVDMTSIGGNIVSQVKVDAHGGNAIVTGVAGSAGGGYGGYIDLRTSSDATAQLDPSRQRITHTGDINISGGQNRNVGSNGHGYTQGLSLWGNNGVTFNGNVTGNGGADVGTAGGTSGYGDYTDALAWYSPLGTVTVNGNMSANGGDGPYRGGNSGGLLAYGAKLAWKGNVSANGGNAKPSITGSVGGDAGWLEFRAKDPVTSTVSGTMTVNGGVGQIAAGANGTVVRLLTCTGPGC